MKTLRADSLAARWLARLARAVCQHPRLFFYPQLGLFVVSVLYTAAFLQFDTSRNDLVGANKKYHQNFLRFKKEFPTQDDLVVVVESEDPEKNRQFVERLGAKIEAARIRIPVQPGAKTTVETNLFTHVFYKGDLKMLGSKALLFVSDETPPTIAAGDIKDLASLAAKLRQPADPVSRYLRTRLSPATRQALARYQGPASDPAPLLATLTNDLNQVLSGPLIFETNRFSGVTLRSKTRRLLAQPPAGDKRAQLNRRLLEDAYPQEIARSDLEELARMLEDYRPFLAPFTHTTNLVSLFDMINTQFRTAKPERNTQTESLIRTIPALERIVTQATASMQRRGVPPSPGVFALFDAGEEAAQSVYITFAGGRIYLATAQALTEELNGEAVDRMRKLVAETRLEVPGLNVGLTGEPVLERDEMVQSQKDTTLASIVALILCGVIFVYSYQETGRPVKATLCLVVGLAYTLAFATLVIGHLNILTITFVPILIGLAIDFGVHLVTRYEEELRHGRSERDALTKAMVFTGQGIFTGAFTTAGAFLAMGLTDFKGIQEMGVICGGGLLICLVPMLTLLPVLLLRGRQNVLDHKQADQVDARERIESLWLRRPVTVIGVAAGLCALSATQFRKVYFDYNLLNMQSAGLPSVEFEEKLIYATTNTAAGSGAGGRSVLFAAVVTDSLDQAVKCEQRLRQLSTVAEVDSVANFLTENQAEKLRLIGEIKQSLASLQFAPPDMRPVDIPALSLSLYSLNGYVGSALDDPLTREDPAVVEKLSSLHQAVEKLRVELFRGSPAERAARTRRLTEYQQALFTDFRDTFEALQHQDNRERLRVEDLPPALRDRFVGVSGKYLLQVYPRKNVWERQNQKEFIQQLRQALDPNNTNSPIITGTPVQLYEYTSLLKRSYEEAAVYSLIAIALLVLVHFRSPGSVMLALAPVGIGSVWLLGIMGWFGIPFNPANIMTLPLVIGIGVTNGIHILNRFAEEHTPSILAKSTGKAVLVSGLTTIAGFGSLILARHRGIESLGYVMATGVTTCMIAGLTFLPALLNVLSRRWVLIKQPSADNARSTLGREEPR
jgi:hopanoid biosynthesis associated RND transporter like protein HpnN